MPSRNGISLSSLSISLSTISLPIPLSPYLSLSTYLYIYIYTHGVTDGGGRNARKIKALSTPNHGGLLEQDADGFSKCKPPPTMGWLSMSLLMGSWILEGRSGRTSIEAPRRPWGVSRGLASSQ
jgi:hypothetical protein